MNKCTIAILDSGVDLNCEELKDVLIDGVNFSNDNSNDSSYYNDDNGHGTSCAVAIKRINKDVNFYVIKVLNRDCETTSSILIEALKYVSQLDEVKIIDINAATLDERLSKEMLNICDELVSKGKIIIASNYRDKDYSFPASFSKVIGVNISNNIQDNQYLYYKDNTIQAVVSAIPIFLPSLNNEYNFLGGTSKGAAVLTGIISMHINRNLHESYNEINEILYVNSLNYNSNKYKNDKNDKNDENDENDYNILTNKYDTALLERLVQSIASYLELSNKSLLYKHNLNSRIIGLNRKDCFKLIQRLEKDFKININYKNITIDIFTNIHTLYNHIFR